MSVNTPIGRNKFITVYTTDAERPASAAGFNGGHLVYSRDTRQLRIADGSAVWPAPLSRPQGGVGATAIGTGIAIITPPIPFDPLGAINVTRSGPPAATASIALQVTAVDPVGLNFTVTSLNAAGAAVLEAASFRWSVTPR